LFTVMLGRSNWRQSNKEAAFREKGVWGATYYKKWGSGRLDAWNRKEGPTNDSMTRRVGSHLSGVPGGHKTRALGKCSGKKGGEKREIFTRKGEGDSGEHDIEREESTR